MRRAFEIVFEDEYIIVLNKIAKLLIQPSPKKESRTLTSLLEEHIKQKVYPCHRVDRETTGLIIYAKERSIQAKIMAQFKERRVKKHYVAFIRDIIKGRKKHLSQKGVLEGFILDREGRRFRERPKKAKTIYKILSVYKHFSVIELEPLTGRTNQLRIQLAQRGTPVLGERIYAYRRDFSLNFKRLALHASFVSFFHPVSSERITLTVGLPEDMKHFLQGRHPLRRKHRMS